MSDQFPPEQSQLYIADTEKERLDMYVARLTGISRSRAQALIKQGCVSLNSRPLLNSAYRLRCNDEVQVYIPEAAESALTPQHIPLKILYEDAHLVVLVKPAGLVVHPAVGHREHTLVHALLNHCRGQLSSVGGVKRPGIVHRLDKGTSGIMVAAKSDEAHQGLSQQFAEHSIERAYKAFIWGVLSPVAGTVNASIHRHRAHRQKMTTVLSGGRHAVTHYRTLETFPVSGRHNNTFILASLVECSLETGRTHQIRVHLSHKGKGIIGDPLYGKAPAEALHFLVKDIKNLNDLYERPALHAFKLGFTHPITKEKMLFEEALPPELVALQHLLKSHSRT